MATIWGLNPSPTYAGAVGDIFVRTTTHEQLRWNGTTWDALAPGETRADTGPQGGAIDTHLAKAGARSFDFKWVNASEGLVFTHDQATAAQEWSFLHRLGARFVDVLVVSPGNISPTAPQSVHVPEIMFDSTLGIRLRFAHPLAGTAIVRR